MSSRRTAFRVALFPRAQFNIFFWLYATPSVYHEACHGDVISGFRSPAKFRDLREQVGMRAKQLQQEAAEEHARPLRGWVELSLRAGARYSPRGAGRFARTVGGATRTATAHAIAKRRGRAAVNGGGGHGGRSA
eukprot:GHVT01044424.1.p1 GENE.GHVT01044424.1~~GHVT01044424.1.p1  ORF type:complete len:134 (+),score=10.79 GHVT01044424.1:624-1025(+)